MTKLKIYLLFRYFLDEDYYKFCVQEYDNSRAYLKSCGKPKDWYDEFMINFHKETCRLFVRYKK